MTHMEIIHGALRTQSHNALFMFREAESLRHLPPAYHGEFEDSSLLAKQSLKVIRMFYLFLFFNRFDRSSIQNIF